MDTVFEIKHVSFAYHTVQGETPTLSDIHFQVPEGQFLSIVGPSGCGKSTLLNLLAGMLTPEEGSVLLHGEPLTPGNRCRIGYMLQQDYLLEWRSILNNVLLGPEIRKEKNDTYKKRALDLLTQYGLSDFADAKPSQLSGGMRQRAALMRTLILEPELLLLDEPFSALDYQTRLTVGDEIGSIIRTHKKTAILVTHDLSEAVSLSDRIIVLSKRPGTVKKDISLTFEPGITPMERRNSQLFKDYFNTIWKELNHIEAN